MTQEEIQTKAMIWRLVRDLGLDEALKRLDNRVPLDDNPDSTAEGTIEAMGIWMDAESRAPSKLGEIGKLEVIRYDKVIMVNTPSGLCVMNYNAALRMADNINKAIFEL